MGYDHLKIEAKWQEYWEENETFKTDIWNFDKPKFYCLDMFPYPSGQGLHVGHPEGYTASDIVSRKKRMEGFNVLHPMGWDAFGLPAEQYAIKTGNHPDGFTEKNIENFTRQLRMLGFSYDWSRTISTADPKYYKWTQWIFKKLYEANLVKEIDMPVNWCEELGTVLANDEVIDGKSERGGYPVVRKNMKQWVIDIVSYAERLLEGLDELNWPQSTKEMQKNWIGKSSGANIVFKVKDSNHTFTVFTTRCDTLFGATYCVLAPEHKIISDITTDVQRKIVDEYRNDCSKKSDIERTGSIEKTGAFTGAYAINPVNNKLIPIFISDYVLASYGTGAIMAVPAHDQRDYDFAKKFNLEIIPVLEGGDISISAFEGDGIHINSGFLDGLNKEDAINKMTSWLTQNHIGEYKVSYRLREWIFARQRYWGEPIPVVHYDDHNEVLDDEELPLVLPVLSNYKPKANGLAPLENATEWVKYQNKNGEIGKRETNTMPGSAGSSWYFLRYIDPKNENSLANWELLKHWMPVDLYIGGQEHAVGHLLYSRFWNNFLYDQGIVPTKEPFKKLVHQGLILGSNGEKMSKSRGNVINPDDVVRQYGADTLRLYEMFMGPLEASLPWTNSGLDGARKFLDRVYRFVTEEEYNNKFTVEKSDELEVIYNQTVKKVSNDFDSLNFNTAISQMMVFLNEAYKAEKIYIGYVEGFIKMLSCITPHICEELWSVLGHNNTIAYESWPTYDDKKTMNDEVTIAIQINGKLRDKIVVPINMESDKIKEMVNKREKVLEYTKDHQIVKEIVIPNKIVNIVIK